MGYPGSGKWTAAVRFGCAAFAIFCAGELADWCDKGLAQTVANSQNLISQSNHMVLKVTVFGSDGRESIEERAIRERTTKSKILTDFPVRQLYCKKVPGTASLVVQKDIVLTAAHVIFDQNCNLKSECFLNDYNGDQYNLDMSTVISGLETLNEKTGRCSIVLPSHPTADTPDIVLHDWAVVKLVKKVRDVTPLMVRPLHFDIDGLHSNDKYTLVGALSMDMTDPKRHMMNLQTCQWRNTVSKGSQVMYIKTDCDVANWMSGGPFVDSSHMIEGILSMGTLNKAEDYDVDRAYSAMAPVSPEMISAIYKLAGKQIPPSLAAQMAASQAGQAQ